jgi:hypothetical protein
VPRPTTGAQQSSERSNTPLTDPTPAAWSTIAEWASTLIPSVTFLTALTFWFGYQVVKARAGYFGLDPSVLGFSTSDFALRAVSAILAPLLYLLVASLILLGTHVAVGRVIARPAWAPALRTCAIAVTAIGATLTAVGLWVIWHKGALDDFKVERPWVLAGGVILIFYGLWVLERLGPKRPRSWIGAVVWRRHIPLLVAFVVAACTFWSFSEYAAQIGAAEARDLVRNQLHDLPRAVVYSTNDLGLHADGVTTEALAGSHAAYHYRYAGLRLLVFSGGKYFLLPDGWHTPADVAIVLPDSSEVRVEFQRKDAPP